MSTYLLNPRSFSWRWREFLLLLPPLILTGVGFYILELLAGELLVERYWPAIVLAVGTLLMHLIFSWLAPRADQLMLPIVAMMNGIGLLMIERLASNFTVRQTVAMAIGMVLCTAITLWNEGPRVAERYRYTRPALHADSARHPAAGGGPGALLRRHRGG